MPSSDAGKPSNYLPASLIMGAGVVGLLLLERGVRRQHTGKATTDTIKRNVETIKPSKKDRPEHGKGGEENKVLKHCFGSEKHDRDKRREENRVLKRCAGRERRP